LADTVDLGSATTGLRIATSGEISDIDGDVSIADNTGITGNLTVTGTTTFNSIAYTWPGTQSAGYVLQTDGSGTLVLG
jgi:hypothetical protein